MDVLKKASIFINITLSKKTIEQKDIERIKEIGESAAEKIMKKIKDERLAYGKNMNEEEWKLIEKKIYLFFQSFCSQDYTAKYSSQIYYILLAFKDFLNAKQIRILFNYLGDGLENEKVKREKKKNILRLLIKFLLLNNEENIKISIYKNEVIGQIKRINKKAAEILEENYLDENDKNIPYFYSGFDNKKNSILNELDKLLKQ